MLYLSQDYFNHLMVKMAHHSTAIEGNTLTQGETKSILIDGYIPRAMDMRELNEVLNYKTYMPQMIEALKNKTKISTGFIQLIHKTLCNEAIQAIPGKFKIIPNMIIGADFETTPPYMVHEELENWHQNLKYQLDNAKTNTDIVEGICRQHIQFEHIHPFPDGNGRVGRALMVYSCIQYKVPAIVIPVEEKKRYINYLNTENLKGLVDFSMELQKKEIQVIKAFYHKNECSFPIHDISIDENLKNETTFSR
ncbi:Fic family protein [Pectinatus frisingensis]|uniref:Fic family protein n=1 Tax=Pectinatus frisingensis TaxID=865 RepID=UPI003D802744